MIWPRKAKATPPAEPTVRSEECRQGVHNACLGNCTCRCHRAV